MKKILILCVFALLFSCGNKPEVAESSLTVEGTSAKATFKVWGNCGMCKKTIEKSLQAEGINSADWDKDSKMISVSFDTTMFSLDEIQQRIAAVGYDNFKYRGNDSAYAELHECCHYERKK